MTLTPSVVALQNYQPPAQGTSLALGFFDGFHLGHQELLRRCLDSPSQPVVFTFRNHPASVLSSERQLQLLTNFEERAQLLNEAGATVVWVDFDRPFSLIEPGPFVEELLLGRLGARQVVTGYNYRYGHRASGNVDTLRQHAMQVITVEPVSLLGDTISSTRVRNLVTSADVRQAAQLLGRPYRLSSRVQRGDQRGRQLGTPTANLSLPPEKAVPAYGVYAVEAIRSATGQRVRGVANLGVRPTVTTSPAPLLEVHLLDFADDLYGEWLHIDFLERVRAEQKFSGLDELKAQIARDVKAAREQRGETPLMLPPGLGDHPNSLG